MAEQSGFFDARASVDASGSIVYDRTYLAESFAKYFASFVGNGVFAGKSNELMVQQTETVDMNVRVLAGQGFINGYFYENTDDLLLKIDNAEPVYDRIDSIVLRWDKYERKISTVVEKGAPSFSPVVSELKRNDDFYDLMLAKISVKAGATRITQADITDMRMDTDVCGFVASPIEHIDTREFNIQLNAWVEQFKADSYAEIDSLVRQLETVIQNSGDVGSLITAIENLEKDKVNKAGDTMTDDLSISKNIQPSLRLIAAAAGSGAVIQAGANQLLLGSRQVASDLNNTRVLAVNNAVLNPDIERALRLINKVNGTESFYNVLHTGNVHLYGLAVVAATVE